MVKVRIHELAKELKMENKDLIKLLEKMGLAVKSVQSTLDDSDVERVKNQISLSKKEGIVEQRVKPTIIRRRVMKEEPAPEPPPPPPKEEGKPVVEAKPPVTKKEEVKPPVVRKEAKPEAAKIVAEAPAEVRAEMTLPRAEEVKAAPETIAVPVAPAAPSPEAKGEEKMVEGPEGIKPSSPAEIPAKPQAAEPKVEAAVPPAGKPAAVPAEKPKPPEKPPKPKKKYEPAKIIERPSVPPPALVREREISPAERRPAGPPKPPIILQRPASPAPARPAPPTAITEEERGRRKKKLKKDVEVLEEGKPGRVRVISTKKRAFKEYDAHRDEPVARPFVFEREPKQRVVTRTKMAKPEITVPKAIKRKIRISEAILVGELAKRMGVKVSEVIKKLMGLGLMVTINQAIDADAASMVAADFGYEVEKTALELEDLIEEREEKAEDLQPRPPVVTIMGHVDHGKTSLLDAIRQTNVTAGEAGGITQHIGAYTVDVDHRKVVFLDTPGHEAFTAMRARGAKVTDIVILVVAADDGVMNQKVEAINHAKAAKVPLIVAINKIDKPNANPERVKQNMTEYGLVPEAWGGDTIMAEISAKQKIGLQELLELILLQAEVLELKANPNRAMTGTVIEAKLDRGRGPVATILVQDGTLHVGDSFVCGTYFGRVRAMINDRGEKMEEAGPSTPVEVIGFSSVPQAGESFVVVTDEKKAKELAAQRTQRQRELELAKSSRVTLEDFYKKMKKGVVKDLNLILKADVQGSIEALTEALGRLSTEAVRVNILHSSVGAINESDCMLASASEAIILGFGVKMEPSAQGVAEQEKIDIRFYTVIYDAIEDVRKAMEGLLEPIYEKRLAGKAKVIQLFNISRGGVVAGSMVFEGKILRGSKAHVVRDGKTVHEGEIATLKRMKDEVKEVVSGFDCGITLEGFQDFQLNDVIESYVVEKVTAHL
ncbi:MAG: translation initiation factor IF-2 [Syntrophaceae bacterium]|nr:translation initiation factor IF-2 [Syntrophaceae bacterium]